MGLTPERSPDRGLFAAISGLTVLTDPVFSTRAGVHLGPLAIGVKRLESRSTVLINAAETSDLVCPHRWARLRRDTYRGYNGYVIENAGLRVLFAGDTAATHAIRAARPIHLAIMPIGAYNPGLRYHGTPEQAWRMAADAGAEYILPVHYRVRTIDHRPSTIHFQRGMLCRTCTPAPRVSPIRSGSRSSTPRACRRSGSWNITPAG